MSELTKKEAAWVKKLQAVLDECPSERIGAYTIGDAFITLYDTSKEQEIQAVLDKNMGTMDFCGAVDRLEAEFTTINTPFAVHSTAG